jgi:phage terminase small subunit
MALTTKQRLFVEYYLQSFNATQAAIKAGYSERSARSIAAEVLAKPDIRAEITCYIEAEGMGTTERLIRLSEIARDKEQKTSDRIRAIELLGKLAGDYVQKVETAGGDDVIRVVINYADEDGG